MMRYVQFIPIAFAALLASGCYYDSQQSLYPSSATTTASCDTSNVTYATTVSGILNSGGSSSCLSCHSANNYVSLGGNIDLDGYANVKIYASNGRLLGAVTHTTGYSAMPKNLAPLSDCDVAAIRTWIRAGTANN